MRHGQGLSRHSERPASSPRGQETRLLDERPVAQAVCKGSAAAEGRAGRRTGGARSSADVPTPPATPLRLKGFRVIRATRGKFFVELFVRFVQAASGQVYGWQ